MAITFAYLNLHTREWICKPVFLYANAHNPSTLWQLKLFAFCGSSYLAEFLRI